MINLSKKNKEIEYLKPIPCFHKTYELKTQLQSNISILLKVKTQVFFQKIRKIRIYLHQIKL